MNEDLKIDIYKNIIQKTDSFEKKAVKETICIIFAKKYANCIKEVHFYSSDLLGDNIDVFQLDYNIYYSNGEFRNGNCMVDTKDVISAFGFIKYEELKKYLSDKYLDNENAWKEIIQEFKGKGLSTNVDESQGGDGYFTNIF